LGFDKIRNADDYSNVRAGCYQTVGLGAGPG
jgi:hypothetical protein